MNTVAKNSVLHFINNKSKMLWMLLFFSAMAWAQPTIVNPTPYQVCDDNNDGFAGFELFTKDAEILGTNAASDYTVNYYATLTDAQNDTNILWSTYTNNTAYNETIYVRVQENANPSNFATTTLDLIVRNTPLKPTVSTTAATCTGNGTATITNYSTSNTYVFTPSGPAVGAGGVISGLICSTPYTVTALANGCYSAPSANFSANCQLLIPPTPIIVTTTATCSTAGTAIITNYNPPNTYTVFPAGPIIAVGGMINGLLCGISYTVTATFGTCTSNASASFSIGCQLTPPTVPASGVYPALETCETGAPLGIETFNLAGTIPTILNGQTGVSVTFYNSLADAYNGTNVITTLGAYTNTVPYVQTLGVALTNTTTGCTSYATMDLYINPQPTVLNPTTPMEVCDDNNDGFAPFDLVADGMEHVVGTTVPSGYTIAYYLTQNDAENNTNPIVVNPYINNTPYSQTIYARVIDGGLGCYTIAPLQLIVHDKPIAGQPSDYHMCEHTLGSNTAVFDLTSLYTTIANGNAMPPYAIYYYENDIDAVSGNITNQIGTPSAYTVTGSQTIWAVLENTVTGCYDVVQVNLVVDPLAAVPASGVYPALETCETGAPLGIETFNLTTAIPTILNGQTGVSVTFYPSLSDAYNGTNVITTLGAYTNTVPYVQTLGVALTNTTAGCTSYATMDLVINPQPTVLNPTTPMEVCDDDNDGYVTFNLSQADTHIVSSVSPTTQSIQYYATQMDADNATNPLGVLYTNNATLPVTIYARVTENITGCYTIAPLELRNLSSAGTISGNQYLCDTVATTQLSSTVSGGTWSSSNTATATVDATGLVTATGIGNTIISYSIGTGSCETSYITVYSGSCPSTNAYNDINNTFLNTPVSGNVLTNDFDQQGDTQVTTPYSGPITGGTLVMQSNGGYVFIPSTGFTGTTTYTYTVCDNASPVSCATAVLTIEILPTPAEGVNTGVTANNDTATTEGTTPVTINVMANDFDEDGDTFTITTNTAATYGTVVLNPDGTFTYTPGSTPPPTDTFTYTICDNGSPVACDTATVTVTINPANTTNDVVANDDAANGNQDTPITGNVLSNDTDTEGNSFTVTYYTQSPHGTVVINPDGTFTYTPNLGYYGPDSFTYTICDTGTPLACDTATVYITINQHNVALSLLKDGVLNLGADATPNVGDIINYTFSVTNTGNTTVNNITISDAMLGLSNLVVSPSTLASGQSATATATYTITQADIDAGFVYNQATVSGVDSNSVPVTSQSTDPTPCANCPINPLCPNCTITPIPQTLTIAKEGTLNQTIVVPSDVANVGDIINYTFSVTNTGNTTVNNITISDAMLGLSNLVVSPSTLASGQSATATATYTITQADIDAGFVYNQATVSGVDSNSVTVTSQSTDPTPCYACPNPSQIYGITIVPLSDMINAGNTNTISGNITIDYDNNGCTTTDTPASYMPILVQSTAQQFYTYANYDGSYTINVPQGNYTITPQLQWNQPGFVVNPTSASANFATNNYLTATQDFCISVATPITDVEVGTYYLNALRPGFDSTFVIYYRNVGNQIVSGNVSFNFDAGHLDFLSVTPSGTVSGGTVTFNYSNLLPGQIEYAYVYLRTHSPTDTLPVNIGETYPFSVAITPATDANPSNNSMSFNATVVGSYDPNNIICTEGNQLPPSEIGNYLHYTVNFENTGNYPADFVNVRIPIDSNLYDVNSLEIVGTSHHFQPKLQNNILDVFFPNIMLDTGGHGNVLLKIKSKNTLQAGDMVYKHAEIYFDYNTPVDTGYAQTVYQTLASQIIAQDNLVTIYPNPATEHITITAQNELQKIEIYDAQGRLVLEKLCGNEKQTTLDVSSRATGLYFIKITTDKGSKLEKLVKE